MYISALKFFISIFLSIEFNFPVWLRSRLISAGLEPVLSHNEKSCIASYYRLNIFHEYQNKINKIYTSFLFVIGRKLSIIRCNKQLLYDS